MDALDQALGQQVQASLGWRKFGVLENPFPSRAHPVWEVFHNQAEVVGRFSTDLGAFVRQGATTTLFFTGGNRVGKTHFFRHHKLILPEKFTSRVLAVPIAVVSSDACDFGQIYRQIVEQIEEGLRAQTGSGLLEPAWIPQLRSSVLPKVEAGDFRNALEVYTAGTAPESGRDALRALLLRWLRGERLPIGVRRDLRVHSNVETLTHQVCALRDVITTIREMSGTAGSAFPYRCPGVLLFLDEFELIWGHRRDRRDRFLQSLRELIDAAPNGLFLCVAMATGLGIEIEDLEPAYPALFARLKGARQIPALIEVQGIPDAQAYASAFLEHARKRAEAEHVPAGKPLFTEIEIQQFFLAVSGGPGKSASQGDYFDKLYTEAELKASE